jgi:hypothetical protein
MYRSEAAWFLRKCLAGTVLLSAATVVAATKKICEFANPSSASDTEASIYTCYRHTSSGSIVYCPEEIAILTKSKDQGGVYFNTEAMDKALTKANLHQGPTDYMFTDPSVEWWNTANPLNPLWSCRLEYSDCYARETFLGEQTFSNSTVATILKAIALNCPKDPNEPFALALLDTLKKHPVVVLTVLVSSGIGVIATCACILPVIRKCITHHLNRNQRANDDADHESQRHLVEANGDGGQCTSYGTLNVDSDQALNLGSSLIP